MSADDRDILLSAIAKARAWIEDLVEGRVTSFAEIAKREGKVERHIRLLAPLAFVSPRIVDDIVEDQVIAVGKRVHFSNKWQTFHDFLRDHLFSLLGKEWGAAELVKPPEKRHRILRWFDQASEDARRTGTKTGEVYTAPMSGATRAFLNLAYNIYLIAHHTEKDGDAIVKGYVDRLKSTRSDDFAGALFETYAAAAFLKAGFTLSFENERDGSVSHVEFVALHPKTGKRFSVEVKARYGRGLGPQRNSHASSNSRHRSSPRWHTVRYRSPGPPPAKSVLYRRGRLPRRDPSW
jgi:hypothetical protein